MAVGSEWLLVCVLAEAELVGFAVVLEEDSVVAVGAVSLGTGILHNQSK